MTTIPTVGRWITEAPWRGASVSLLQLDSMTQAHTLSDKRELAVTPHSGLLVLWTGRYRTDARRVTAEELEQIRDLLA